jgi:hypothetical protein
VKVSQLEPGAIKERMEQIRAADQGSEQLYLTSEAEFIQEQLADDYLLTGHPGHYGEPIPQFPDPVAIRWGVRERHSFQQLSTVAYFVIQVEVRVDHLQRAIDALSAARKEEGYYRPGQAAGYQGHDKRYVRGELLRCLGSWHDLDHDAVCWSSED